MMERESEQDRIRDLLKISPKGLSIEEVSKKLSLNRATAAKYLNALVMAGQADMRALGPAKLFYFTERLPLTNLLSLSSDLILILDNELFVQEANDPFLSFFRLNKEELKGKKIEHSPLAEFFLPEHFAAVAQALEGTELTGEIQFEDPKGTRFFKIKYLPLVFESGGRAVGITLEDITEMKNYQLDLENRVKERTETLVKTNIALQESEKKFREIFNNTNDAIHITEVNDDGIPGKFIEVNDVALRMLKYSRQELFATGPLAIATSSHSRSLDEIGKEILTNGHATFETGHRKKDGTIIPVEINAHLVLMQGQRVLISVVRDITERKRSDEVLRRATKQLVLLNSITRHDILNQLNNLAGFLGIMKITCPDEKAADLIRKEEEIAETIRRQITFTRDYQNIGVQPPGWKNVRETITRVTATLDKGSVVVENDAGELEIYADQLIEKVFFNLIENAIRHGGSLSLIRISHERKANDIILFFEDNGTGIPADEKEKIFERGYGKNTGFGLFLSREILSITGLSIRENGTPGKGARFEILVPEGSYRFQEPPAESEKLV